MTHPRPGDDDDDDDDNDDSSSFRVVFTSQGRGAEIQENSRPRRFRFSEPSRYYN